MTTASDPPRSTPAASSADARSSAGAARALRVGFDLMAERYGVAGTARAALGLYGALLARDDVDVRRLGGGSFVRPGTPRRKIMALGHDLLWFPALGRSAAARARVDVYHVPMLRGPFWRGSPPTVITAHDVVPLRHPETMSTWNRLYSRAAVRRLLGSADRVIASSCDTADDLVRLAGLGADRVRLVRVGIEERFFGPPPAPPLAEPYILFVGTLEPRKNLVRLLAAHELRRKRGRAETLVIAGATGWGGVHVGGKGVHLAGRVSDEVLHALVAHASALVIPSLHEGFGLPAVEAMAAGTPVVASRAGALPEVCGGAAVMVDPLDVRSIADGIDEALADADALRRRGCARAAHFHWSDVAADVLHVYREIA